MVRISTPHPACDPAWKMCKHIMHVNLDVFSANGEYGLVAALDGECEPGTNLERIYLSGSVACSINSSDWK